MFLLSGVRVDLCKEVVHCFSEYPTNKYQSLTTFVYVLSLGRDAGFSYKSAGPVYRFCFHSGRLASAVFVLTARPRVPFLTRAHSCSPSAIELRFSWRVGWPMRSLRRRRKTGTMPGSRRCVSTSWCVYLWEYILFQGGDMPTGMLRISLDLSGSEDVPTRYYTCPSPV